MSTTTVTTWYLEMRSRHQLVPPSRLPDPAPRIERVVRPSPAFARYLYTAVGGDWHWIDRLPWNLQHWQDWLGREEVRLWVAYLDGAPLGYIETERQAGGEVEIAYFGLLPHAIGKGFASSLLHYGLAQAWALPDTRRVWVHSCSLDHPRALPTYRARGFQLYHTTEHPRPARPAIGPWPGAYAR